MSETNTSYLTKAEFRIVALVLAAFLITPVVYLVEHCETPRFLPVKAPPESPILVGGGAMTGFTADQNGWQGPVSGPYCTNTTDISQIVFTDYSTGAQTTWSSLNAPWTLRAYSQKPLSGLQFVAIAKGCQPGQGNFSVTLSAIKGSFYTNHLQTHVWYLDAVRYRDIDTSTAGCISSFDEDVCERMGQVDLYPGALLPTAPPPALPQPITPPPTPAACLDGNCFIAIGKPLS
jgi:hypothetical protein